MHPPLNNEITDTAKLIREQRENSRPVTMDHMRAHHIERIIQLIEFELVQVGSDPDLKRDLTKEYLYFQDKLAESNSALPKKKATAKTHTTSNKNKKAVVNAKTTLPEEDQ